MLPEKTIFDSSALTVEQSEMKQITKPAANLEKTEYISRFPL